MEKRIVEVTQKRENGFLTELLFAGGLDSDEGKFSKITLNGIKAKQGEEEMYELTAVCKDGVGREYTERVIYPLETNNTEEIKDLHLEIVNKFIREYFNSFNS